jgi:hypothetical protein
VLNYILRPINSYPKATVFHILMLLCFARAVASAAAAINGLAALDELRALRSLRR